DEYGLLIRSLCESSCGGIEEISGVVICSVVPPVTGALEQMSREFLKLPPVVVRSDLELDIIIDYYDPTEVGADRLANAVAVHELIGEPSIVVDFGTATTFDVVTADGHYRGGAIAPGVRTSSENLFRQAALLHGVRMEAPGSVIGRSTDESLRAGIIYGAVGQVDAIVLRIAEEWGEDPLVVATGGLAATIAPFSKTIGRIEPDLTLKGLSIIYSKVTEQ
ncbi:type III pantothenate kinase, partial [bacterium]|nr:type III pantothenate kinase [bacterium]